MLLNRDLPVPLVNDQGILWVDNADGTVTDTSDDDGYPDRHWDSVPVRDVVGLHGYTCRLWNLRALCMGGWECADAERVELVTHARRRAMLGSMA